MFYLGLIAIILGIISVFITINYMKHTDKIIKEIKYIRNKCISNSKIKEREFKVIELIKKLQNQSKLSIDDIYNIVFNYKNPMMGEEDSGIVDGEHRSIVEEEDDSNMIAEEEYRSIVEEEDSSMSEYFHNYIPGVHNKKTDFLYTSAKSRGVNNKGGDSLEKNLKKILDIDKVKELSNILTNYRGLFDRTFERIKTITDMDISMDTPKKKFKGIVSSKKTPLTCSKNNLNNLQMPLQKLKFCQKKINGKSYCFRISKNSLCDDGKIVKDVKKCDFY